MVLGGDVALYWKGRVPNICIRKVRLDAAPEVDCHSNPGIFIVACSRRMLDSIDIYSHNCSNNIIAGSERRWLNHRQKSVASLLNLSEFFRAEREALWFDN